LLGLALGQEGLFADDVEVAQEQLAADRAAPAAALALDEFEPRLVAVVEEARADRALLVDLGMGIVGIAGAEADALEEIAAVSTSARMSARVCLTSRRTCSASTSGSSEKRTGTP
jgi:hypothetical protein